MEYPNNIKEMLDELIEAGFKIPDFKLDIYLSDERGIKLYNCTIVDKSIDDLDLNTYLDMCILLKPMPSILKPKELYEKGQILFEGHYNLFFDSLYNENGGGEEYSSGKEFIPQLKEEIKLIECLEEFLSAKPDSISSARRTMSGVSGKTWGQLYGLQVKEKKLKWAELFGERFPYVVTKKDKIGSLGRSEGGLYFVATDVAKQPWQELIVAYHERFCQEGGHEKARIKELELARHLGKEKEYSKWRTKISNGF